MRQIQIANGFRTEPGLPYNLGANMDHQGANFALFSKHATSVELLFFNQPEDAEPSHRFLLDPYANRTGDVWHIYLYDIKPGQLYGYLVDGPFRPEEGHRFNRHKLLVDPYAKAVAGRYLWDKPAAYNYVWDHPYADQSFSTERNFGLTAKAAVVDSLEFDWEEDRPLNIPLKDSVIYEVHLKAFTQDKASAVSSPGTYRGMIEKIPYLKDLGITCVELLPIHDFNPFENTRTNPETGEPLLNFWGYSTLNFFAPASWYSSDGDGRTAVGEFKEMVKAFHQAGIEVLLDVVYNHTAEGNEFGPTHSFRGLDNSIYYMLAGGRYYQNYSGCGNTLNCNHTVVRNLIMDSLRYWVVDMHVDGFRFDLAAILGRDSNGDWVPNHSVLNDIAQDPILSKSKIIAEGWDAAGLYKVGGFPHGWAEWNAHYRDDIRSYVKSDRGAVTRAASRIAGSSDIFHWLSKRPYQSINFITAHDGFTLSDLVSYNYKHNYANAEDNRDGNSHNLSWNCGVEGLTKDAGVLRLRDRQMKNFMALLMVSQGTPMMLYGDEVKFSKLGNNNTYSHNNHLNWFPWKSLEPNRAFFEFCRFMIHFRKRHPSLRREGFFRGLDLAGNDLLDVTWLGVHGNQPDWSWESHCLAFLIDGHRFETGAHVDDNNIYIALNFFWEDKTFTVPAAGPGRRWVKVVDTNDPRGFWEEEAALPSERVLNLASRSLVILVER